MGNGRGDRSQAHPFHHPQAPDDLDRFQAWLMERGWGDGLPAIPPTRERVAATLAGTRRRPDEVVAILVPRLGRATVEALRAVSTTWNAVGPNARDVFLFQKLESLIGRVVSTIQQPRIDKIIVTGQGSTGGASLAAQLATTVEQVRAATGVDLTKILPESATRSAPQRPQS